MAAPFLLVFCLTGLFLLFGGEFYDWNTLGSGPKAEPVPEKALYAHVEEAVSRSVGAGQAIQSVRFAPTVGRIRVRLLDTAAPRGKMGQIVDFYLRDGRLQQETPDVTYRYAWLNDGLFFLRRLHVRLNDGEAGRVLMAVACALSMVSIGTGFLLYPRFMKGLSFGERRQFSWRLWWSDWHKALGILAGGWLFVLSFSGLTLYLYRQGADGYQASAYEAAQAAFPPAAGASLSIGDAMARLQSEEAKDRVLAIFPPDARHSFFAFEVADASSESALHTVRRWIFLSADGQGALLAPPPPAWSAIGSLAVNLHLRNHDTFALKGLWAFFLLLSTLLTVSGIAIYLARFPKSAAAKRTVAPLFAFGRFGVWALALLPVAGLFLPLHGAEGLGTAAFSLVAIGTLCLVDKTWIRGRNE